VVTILEIHQHKLIGFWWHRKFTNYA